MSPCTDARGLQDLSPRVLSLVDTAGSPRGPCCTVSATSETAVTTLLVLGAGVHQEPYLRRAHQEGIRTLAVDADKDAPGAASADMFVEFPLRNHLSEHEIDALLSLFPREAISGVLVAGVELAVLGSRICHRLNAPGISEQTAIRSTDKLLRLQTLAASGALVPRYAKVTSMGLPAGFEGSRSVLKPRYGSGSRGVAIIDSERDLETALNEAIRVAGSNNVYIEEFIDGVEYSVEAFMVNGEPYTFCAARRDMEVTEQGTVVDWGSATDPSDPMIPRLVVALQNAAQAIGLGTGPTKADLLVTEGQVAVLEVAARSAPLAPLIAEQIAGFDAVGIQIAFALGEPLSGVSKPNPTNAWVPWVHRYAIPKPGLLRELLGSGEVLSMPGALLVMPLLQNRLPAQVDPARPGDRPFYVAATGTTVHAAETNALSLIESVELVYA